MIKRLISLALVLCLLCSVAPSLTLRGEAASSATAPSATAAQIDALFTARSKGQHPRILANSEDFARVRKLIQTDPYMKAWYERIYQYCVEQLTESVSEYVLTNSKMLNVSRVASHRITWMAFLYQVSGERRFAQRAVEEMLAVCAFSDWHPSHYLDVGQMAYGVGIGYDWLYHYLTDSQRTTISKALYNYAIVTSNNSTLSYEVSITNWNPWCHAGVSIAALAIYEDYSSACSTYLSGAVTNVQTGITHFTPMGAYAEGPQYFQLCGGFMVLFFETLFSTLGTDFGLSQMDGIRESGSYLLAVNGETAAFNHGDGDAVVVDGAMLHWFANRFNMPQLSYFQREIQSTSVLYDEILALLWYDPLLLENYSPADQQLDYLLYSDASESVASFRSFPGSAQQIYAAIKSGYNSSNHTDLDIGTFVMDAMGERWFEDLGKDSYSLSGYSGGYSSASGYDTDALRWNYYRKRAEGQNTLVINPDATGGQSVTAKCQITDYQSSYDGGFAKVNMLNAYKDYKATAVNRALMLFDNRSRVLLRDEVTCSASSKIYWFAHTKAAVSLSADGKTAELTLNGKTLLAQICSPSTAKFTVMNATPLSTSPKSTAGELARDEYRKLSIYLNGVTSANIAVVFTPIVEESDRDKYLPTGGISVFSGFLSGKDPATELTANAEGVYEIYTADQLRAFANAVNAGNSFAGQTVRLMNDIDLTGRSFTPIGGAGGTGVFKGTFDGGKHCIRNLFIFERSATAVGFFGKVSGAVIQDVGIESGIVFGGKTSAGLIGSASSVTVSGCYNKATVISTAGNSGGIIGQLGGTSTISNCYNHANIRCTDSCAGGIVGYIASGTTTEILSCYHIGTLTDSLGKLGLIGFYNTESESYLIKHITVKNCFSTNNIKGSTVADNSSLETYSGNGKVSAAQLMDSLPSDAFVYDCEWENGGYPVFTWQCDTVLPADLVLNTEAELRLLAYTVNSGKDNFSGKTVKLGQNIDLDSREWIPIGGSETENSTSRVFRGTFDGQGYGIRNLSVTTGNYYAGFFGAMQGKLFNFGVLSGRVLGNYKTGGLVGSFSGTMENCFSRASISGKSQTGGLVGMSGKMTMSNCYCTGSVSATIIAGGLVGYLTSSASNTSIRDSYSSSALSGSQTGGLVANINTGATSVTLTNCHALSGYSLVHTGSTHTLSGCSSLAAADLKAAAETLGAGFFADTLYPQNGGYPLLQVFAYGVDLPTLVADETGVYNISTAQELRAVAKAVNVDGNSFAGKTLRLVADIDLEMQEWIPIGTDISFAGTFDGNGHIIENLCVTSGNNYVGLFGRLAGATVENLGIESGTVMGTGKVSALAGSIRNGTVIRNCFNRATVSGRTIVGGIVGMAATANCTVENCYNTGSVSAYSSVGGVVGYLAGDTTNFAAIGCYEGSSSGLGLIGVCHASVTTAEMENCYAIDTGSLVGTQNSLTVTNCETVTAAQLQGKAAEMGTAFAEDYLAKNQLYPVLQWENAQASTSFQEKDGVYLIQSEADLRLLSYLVRKGQSFQGESFLLTTDLDLESRPWLPIGGTDATGTKYFKGNFHGGGHKISNLNVRIEYNHAGLFGIVSDCLIENLGVESGTVLGKQYAGGLVGRVYANSTIQGCYNKAMVYAKSNSGGLIGRLNSNNITVENCYNTGVVTAKTTGSSTGSLVGILSTGIENTWLRNCYNVGNRYGLVGTGGADMVNSGAENCYSTGSLRLYKLANAMILTNCVQISDESMKALAPTLGEAFVEDAGGINQGYPILVWESEAHCFHEYSIVSDGAETHSTVCALCGDRITEAHSFDEGMISKEASCTEEGVKTYTCTVCKEVKTEAISATGHTPVTDAAVAPTCTTAGKTEGSHCDLCNAVITAQTTIPALGHSYDNGQVTTEPTCTNAGVKTYTCSKCSHSYTEAIAATGHSTVTVAGTPATCTNSGTTDHIYCSVCNTVLQASEVLPRLGHDYSYTNNGDTHTATCSRCDKTLTADHSFTDSTCVCGAKEAVLDESIKIYHTLDLASDISITFAVPVSALASYDSYYLECVLPEYEGNTQTGTSTVQIQPVVNGNYYYFTLTGITAVRMGDMVDAVLHMTKDDAEYISKTDSYSVATYAYAMLNSSSDTKMLALCADLLSYGAKAQIFKNYRTDALVDANMTEAHMAYLSDLESVTFGNNNEILKDVENAPITWAGKTLNLDSKVELKFVFKPVSYTGSLFDLTLRVSYADANGNLKSCTVENPELYSASLGFYAFTVDVLLASELRTVLSVQIYEGDTPLSCTLRFSADTYGNNQKGDLLTLCKALFAYSDSARVYFSS